MKVYVFGTRVEDSLKKYPENFLCIFLRFRTFRAFFLSLQNLHVLTDKGFDPLIPLTDMSALRMHFLKSTYEYATSH